MGCGDFCADRDRGHDHRAGHALFRQPGPGRRRRRANNDNGQPPALCDSQPGESLPKFLRKSFDESLTKSFAKLLRESVAQSLSEPRTDSYTVSRYGECVALILSRSDG